MNLLGNRLEEALTLLSTIENNELFADIGSDHAFLAIEAVRRGIAKKAVCGDINLKPLKIGEENARNHGVDIDFILSDGFDNLDNRKLTSAAVCGMGGELIAKMVLRSEIAHNCTLVLQPMTAQEDLRKTLWDNGFCIHSESFVIDSGKAYALMLVSFDGKKREYSYTDLFLGKERKNGEGFKKYCEKIQAAAEKRRLGLVARNESTDEIDALIKECHLHITSF